MPRIGQEEPVGSPSSGLFPASKPVKNLQGGQEKRDHLVLKSFSILVSILAESVYGGIEQEQIRAMKTQNIQSELPSSAGQPDLLEQAKMVLAEAYTARYPMNARLDAAIGRKVNRSGVHARAFVLPHKDVKVSLSSAIDLCEVLGIETTFQPKVSLNGQVILHEAPIMSSQYDSGLHLCRRLRIELGEAIRRFADIENLKIKDLSDRLQIARPTISSLTSDDLERQFGPRAAMRALQGLGLDVELGLKLIHHDLPDFKSFHKARRSSVVKAALQVA
jgi:predicted XRE-type DNA-binding protein